MGFEIDVRWGFLFLFLFLFLLVVVHSHYYWNCASLARLRGCSFASLRVCRCVCFLDCLYACVRPVVDRPRARPSRRWASPN